MKHLIFSLIFITFLFLSCNDNSDLPVISQEKTTSVTDDDMYAFVMRMTVYQYDNYSQSYVEIYDRMYNTGYKMCCPNWSSLEWFVTNYMTNQFKIKCTFEYLDNQLERVARFSIFEKNDWNSTPKFNAYLPIDHDSYYVEQIFEGENLLQPDGHWYYGGLAVYVYNP